MYGSETWIMTKKIENIINSYERQILRRILGPINDNGTWRIRYNKKNIHLMWRPGIINSYKIEKITMGRACAKNGESNYTQDGDGWSDVWKTASREA
jgi:hypothetical protein